MSGLGDSGRGRGGGSHHNSMACRVGGVGDRRGSHYTSMANRIGHEVIKVKTKSMSHIYTCY